MDGGVSSRMSDEHKTAADKRERRVDNDVKRE